MMLTELNVKCILTFLILTSAFIIHSLASEILMQTNETLNDIKQTSQTITITVTKESN